jgi:hypothetical protein
VGKRHRRIRAQSATGQVAGAATEQSPGSKPIVQTGLPIMRSPGSPCSGWPTVWSGPDVSFRGDFHVPNLERASVDGALLVIEVKSERDVPVSFRYRRGNRRRFGAARLTKLAEDALLMRLTDAASNQRPSACLAVRPFRPPRAQKAWICRAFEAADGTRTHDLLHGKQLLRSVFVLSTRIRAVGNRRGSRAITGGSGNRLVSASK